jgi:LmbE family N-acetylglucosaminyl deacetylase
MPLDFLKLEPVLIVAAHPDDETVGVGGQFGRLKDPYILHVTDGAPLAAGASRSGYAETRRREFEAAMGVAGFDMRRSVEFGAVDQETAFSLGGLTKLLLERMREIRPQVVFTHPYEGGHPDHDSCAFMVQTAAGMMESPPLRMEFTSYHNGSPHAAWSTMKTGEFLPGPKSTVVALTPAARERKRRMLDCYTSQQHVLKEFSVDQERFRAAPHYDFSKAPHAGSLYYDDKNWRVTSSEWRKLAIEAFANNDCSALA